MCGVCGDAVCVCDVGGGGSGTHESLLWETRGFRADVCGRERPGLFVLPHNEVTPLRTLACSAFSSAAAAAAAAMLASLKEVLVDADTEETGAVVVGAAVVGAEVGAY